MPGPVPLRQRRTDLIFVAFFLVNLACITYMVDLEQLVVANPQHFTYPVWPPGPVIDLVHWYGNHYDPLLMARPPFWRMTISSPDGARPRRTCCCTKPPATSSRRTTS